MHRMHVTLKNRIKLFITLKKKTYGTLSRYAKLKICHKRKIISLESNLNFKVNT